MSVYTRLSTPDVCGLLARYDIGELVSYEGIEAGVENTNYFLDVSREGVQKRYVLTLFEYLPESTLPFFIGFTDELSAGGISVPNPVRDRNGDALHHLKGKPALIVPCFKGEHPSVLTTDLCRQIGETLGRIHRIGQQSELTQENQRGVHWLNKQQQRLQSLLNPKDSQYMAEQWRSISQELEQAANLPKGLIHGDLFHDNVLFEDNRITGVIDFYNACHDWLLYDLAVTTNDWCLNEDLSLDSSRCDALLAAYASVRPFTQEEKRLWPLMLRLAAFRFWVSRIITFIHPDQEVDQAHEQSLLGHFKDPDEFRDILFNRTHSDISQLQ